MSTELITSQILEEAQSAREDLLHQADQKCSEILANAEKMAANIKTSAEKKGIEERDKAVLRRKSVAFIDSRKVLLEKKQEIIKECFDEAIDVISALDKDKYIDLLVSMGIKSGMNGGELKFNEKDKSSVAAEVVKKLNKALAGSGENDGTFTLSDETANVKGGYVITNKLTYSDCTIESLLNENKLSMVAEVSAILFPESK